MYLELDTAKKHLNVDTDFIDDDVYISALIKVAEEAVAVNLDKPLAELEIGEGELPSPILQAMLLMVGNLYANREPIAYSSVNKLPLSYDYLIALYKNYNGAK